MIHMHYYSEPSCHGNYKLLGPLPTFSQWFWPLRWLFFLFFFSFIQQLFFTVLPSQKLHAPSQHWHLLCHSIAVLSVLHTFPRFEVRTARVWAHSSHSTHPNLALLFSLPLCLTFVILIQATACFIPIEKPHGFLYSSHSSLGHLSGWSPHPVISVSAFPIISVPSFICIFKLLLPSTGILLVCLKSRFCTREDRLVWFIFISPIKMSLWA